MREKLDDLRAANGSRKQPEVEVPPGHARNRRPGLPVEVILQHRRLSAGRPSTAAVRTFAQSAFVDEDDRAAFVFGFFLTPASASASTAESSLRSAPGLGRWDADSSIPTAAECAKPAKHGSGPHIRPRSGGPLAPKSTARSHSPKPGVRASARARSSSGLAHSTGACVPHGLPASAQPGLFRPTRPPTDLTDWRCTPTCRATSDWWTPFFSSRAARRRRRPQLLKVAPYSGCVSHS